MGHQFNNTCWVVHKSWPLKSHIQSPNVNPPSFQHSNFHLPILFISLFPNCKAVSFLEFFSSLIIVHIRYSFLNHKTESVSLGFEPMFFSGLRQTFGMGAATGKPESPTHVWAPETKLESQILEAMRRREAQGTNMKSFNSIIMKFPKIDESFKRCKEIFDKFDEDSNGAIDREELKKCCNKLELTSTEEEINDLFEACDINEDMAIKFNEFIVLLCLVYLLKDNPTALQAKSRMGMPKMENTFETLVDAFVFLDKNMDGYVSKTEMIQAINESGERSSGRIAMKRFEEMDWDKNGTVNFKEFLFAFTRWVGIDDFEDEDEGEEKI